MRCSCYTSLIIIHFLKLILVEHQETASEKDEETVPAVAWSICLHGDAAIINHQVSTCHIRHSCFPLFKKWWFLYIIYKQEEYVCKTRYLNSERTQYRQVLHFTTRLWTGCLADGCGLWCSRSLFSLLKTTRGNISIFQLHFCLSKS